MERKIRLSICAVGGAQWPQLAASDRLGHYEGIAPEQIDVALLNERRQPCYIDSDKNSRSFLPRSYCYFESNNYHIKSAKGNH